jgi:ABC-type glycerol-3-phosphate transport system substrate-binding protein
MEHRLLTRRTMLKRAAMVPVAATLSAPFVRGAYAAGRLSVGMWDHWVPGASEVIEKLSREWAAKEKIDLTFDLITSNGDKLALTLAGEGQAGAGHDVMHFPTWYAAAHAEHLVPVDDITQENIAKYGDPAPGCEYLGKIDGHWVAVPTAYNSGALPPCARIDLLKQFIGLDVTKMYSPPGQPRDQELIDKWTWDFFLDAAEKAMQAGNPFGLGMSTCTDAINANDTIFRSYGVRLVNDKGDITVKSDGTKQMLEWFKKLVKFMPESVYSWDNSSNNKYLISGQGSLIMNPPSCWAVAVRDAPKIGEQLWTFSSPKGPNGRYDPGGYAHWGIWRFSKSQEAAKAWLRFMTSRESQEKLVTAGRGFDIPPYKSMMDFKVWEDEGPPKGTNYNYPPRGDVQVNVAGYPAPVKIGTQMFAQGTMNKMIAMYTQQGKSMNDAMAWAETEIEGFMRS